MKKQAIYTLVSLSIILLMGGITALVLFLTPETVSAKAGTDLLEIRLAETAPTYETLWGTAGGSSGQFNNPFGIAVGGTSYVYSADSGNNRVQRTDTSGGSNTVIGSGLCPGGPVDPLDCMNSPAGVAVDGSGNLFVTNAGNNRVQKFNSSGTIVWVSGDAPGEPTYNQPRGVAVNSGGTVIYVADTGANIVRKLDANGLQTLAVGVTGPTCAVPPGNPPGDGCLNGPRGVAIDGSGNIYVADTGNNWIQKFNGTTGAFMAKWGKADATAGTNDFEFNGPTGITIDGTGNIYIVDRGNSRVQKFNSALDTKLYQLSTGTGYVLNLPTGVAVNSAGKVFIMNAGSSQVLRFGSASAPPTGATPSTPTLVSPAGNVFLPSSMLTTYVWNRVEGATEYDLYISGGEPFKSFAFYNITAATAGCAGAEATCGVTPAAATLTVGSYNYWVRARNSSGSSFWSAPSAFVALPPMPPASTLTAPIGGVATTQNPTFTWTRSPGANSYHLWVRQDNINTVVINQYYLSSAAGCTTTDTCSVISPLTLANGQHTWKVYATNQAGETESPAGIFNVIAPPVPPTQVSPTGDVDTQYPTYTWRRVDNATAYRLWVAAGSGGAPVFLNTYTSTETGCPGSELNCTIVSTSTMKLNAGGYTWWIQGVNSVGVRGAWSTGLNFNVLPPAPPATTLRVPVGGATDKQTQYPTFSWDRVEDATWYRLVVGDSSFSSPTVSKWFSAADVGCTTMGPCVATSGTAVGAGLRTWKVTTWNAGRSTESATATFFAILPPEPPVPTSPVGDVGLPNMEATYVWSGTAGAVAYRVIVDGGTAAEKSIIVSGVCNTSLSCTLDPNLVPGSPVLTRGSHKWKVQGLNELGVFGNLGTELTFNATVLPPPAPTGLVVEPLNLVGDTTSKPKLKWNSVSSADRYNLKVENNSETPVVIDNYYSNSTANCDSLFCWVESPITLNPTTHTWTVKAENDGGSATSASATFYPIQQWGDTPKPIYPSGNVNLTTASTVPLFKWNRVEGAVKYRVGIQNSDGTDKWIGDPFSSLVFNCNNYERYCFTSEHPGAPPLSEGTYRWWFQPFGAGDAPGATSELMTFVALPAKPPAATDLAVTPLIGPNTTRNPMFQWSNVSKPEIINRATWYGIEVRAGDATGPVVLDSWVSATDTNCLATTCFRQSPVMLNPGNYSWVVRTWNSGGPTRSTSANFIAVQQWGEVPILISPSGTITLPSSMQTTFTWNKIEGATDYQLYITNSLGLVVHNTTFSALTAGCDTVAATVCSYSPVTSFPEATYTWYIQPKKSGVSSYWSVGLSFTTKSPPPAAPTLIPFVGDPSTTPTYQWNPVGAAAYYGLEVRKGSATGTVVLTQWVTPTQASCAASCSLTPTTRLTPGQHTWVVKTWNTSGMATSAPDSFWAIQQMGEKAVQISPSGILTVGTSGKLPFTWNRVQGAVGYRVYIQRNPATPVLNVTFLPGDVGCAALERTCTLPTSHASSPDLISGDYTWWVQAQGATLVWSDGMTFTPAAGVPNLLSPANLSTVPNNRPLFTWERVAPAMYYQLTVFDNTGTVKNVERWVTAEEAGCALPGSTCSFYSPALLSPGLHTWKIRTWNPVTPPTAETGLWTFTVP